MTIKTTLRRVTRKGITFSGRHYWSPELVGLEGVDLELVESESSPRETLRATFGPRLLSLQLLDEEKRRTDS
jgi:hypothetical protein